MPKRILRIGIDIDDVLLQSAKRSIEMYNKSFGTSIALDDWYNFDDHEVWSKVWGEDDMRVLVSRVVATMADEAFNSVEPIDDASEALAHLNVEGHELFAITGRAESIREQTAFILDKYFPGIFRDETLFFVDHYAHDGQKASKVDVALRLGITHFIEDLPAHANGLARAGIQTILFSPGYKWNEAGADADVADKVIVLDSWPKIVEHLDAESAR